MELLSFNSDGWMELLLLTWCCSLGFVCLLEVWHFAALVLLGSICSWKFGKDWLISELEAGPFMDISCWIFLVSFGPLDLH